MKKKAYDDILSLIGDILENKQVLEEFVRCLSVTVTEMFRDPEVYQAIRNEILPMLEKFPTLNIWHAGCATGEEVFSLVILLKEEGVLDKCHIYASDINKNSLELAPKGILTKEGVTLGLKNYKLSGGKYDFEDYCYIQDGKGHLSTEITNKPVFFYHDLSRGNAIDQMHVIFCRNVLIYFNRKLQNQVLKLLTESLHMDGVLCLGTKESLEFTLVHGHYRTLSEAHKLYQKKGIDSMIEGGYIFY